jgi:hypothetical protein
MSNNLKRIVFAVSTNRNINYRNEALFLLALAPENPQEDSRITQARIELNSYAKAILSYGENYPAIIPIDLEKALQKLLRSKKIS